MSEEKKMLRCTVLDKNAIKTLEDSHRYCQVRRDKGASKKSLNPCLVSYPPPHATINGPSTALPVIYLAIMKLIWYELLVSEQQNWGF